MQAMPNSNNVPMHHQNPANVIDRAVMAALCNIKAKPVKNNLKAPIISFSFDDCPKSATTTGAQLLEANDIRASFYITGSHCDAEFENIPQYNKEDLKKLHDNGHEIACHSFSHPRLRGRKIDDIAADLEQNRQFVANCLGADNGFKFESFAYPYGEFDIKSRNLAANHFQTARGVYRGVNKGIMDFANLRTTPLEKRRFSTSYLKSHIDDAIANNGWIIFFTHEVCDGCTDYGSTPAIMEETIAMVKNHGLEVLTVKDAANKILGK